MPGLLCLATLEILVRRTVASASRKKLEFRRTGLVKSLFGVQQFRKNYSLEYFGRRARATGWAKEEANLCWWRRNVMTCFDMGFGFHRSLGGQMCIIKSCILRPQISIERKNKMIFCSQSLQSTKNWSGTYILSNQSPNFPIGILTITHIIFYWSYWENDRAFCFIP